MGASPPVSICSIGVPAFCSKLALLKNSSRAKGVSCKNRIRSSVLAKPVAATSSSRWPSALNLNKSSSGRKAFNCEAREIAAVPDIAPTASASPCVMAATIAPASWAVPPFPVTPIIAGTRF